LALTILTVALAFFLLTPPALASEPVETADGGSIESFERLLERYPDSEMRAPVLLILGNLYAQREKTRYLAEVAEHESRLATYASGERSGAPRLDYAEAITAFREVAELGRRFAGSVDALHALGVCYEEMGKIAEAERCLTKASRLASDPTLRVASLLRLGDLRFAAERWERRSRRTKRRPKRAPTNRCRSSTTGSAGAT